jgi:hypothetical protein
VASEKKTDAQHQASEQRWAEQVRRTDETLRLVTRQLEIANHQAELSSRQLESVEATLSAFRRSQWPITRDLRASASIVMPCERLPLSLRSEACSRPLEEHTFAGALSRRNRQILQDLLPVVHIVVWRSNEGIGGSERENLFEARIDMSETRAPIFEAYDLAHNEETAEVTLTCEECLTVDVTFVSQHALSFMDFEGYLIDVDFLSGACDAGFIAERGGYPCVPDEIQLLLPSGRRIFLTGFEEIDEYQGVFRAQLKDVTGTTD